MVRPGSRIVIRCENDDSAAIHERQRRNLILLRLRARLVRQIQPRQIHRQPIEVIEFHKIIRQRRQPIRQPLIDLQRRRITGSLRHIRRPKRRHIKLPAPIAHSPNRQIIQLRPKRHPIDQAAAISQRVIQINTLPRRPQREIGVYLARDGFAIRKHDQILPRIDRHIPKRVLAIPSGVADRHPLQIHGRCAIVIQLDDVA